MGTVVLIGDVGGHPDELRRAVIGVGAQGADLVLPPDVTVVQVGDLVDRGPDSHGVLTMVDGMLRRQPDQWIQLVGNHEAQYLSRGATFWPERLDSDDAGQLLSWWDSGQMRVAVAVRTADGDDFLVTHAGLTVQCWHDLREPSSAEAAARLLNERPEPLIWRGGPPLFDTSTGPLWTEAGLELLDPWFEHYNGGGFVPFGQIHGHSTIVRYADRSFRCPGRVRQRATVDWDARHVRVRVGGRVFTGIDPHHGRRSAQTWQPLILTNATVLGR
jgi:hypothetical protein